MSMFFPAFDSRNRDGRFRDVRVERARQPFVAGDNDQQNVVFFGRCASSGCFGSPVSGS